MEVKKEDILQKVFKSFRLGIGSSKSVSAKEYLNKLGLDFRELEIGWNSANFHLNNRLSKEDTQACIETGLLKRYDLSTPKNKDKDAYVVFGKKSLIFPIKDVNNTIVSFYAKSTQYDSDSFLNKEGLYPKFPDKRTRHLIITENITDAAILLQEGLTSGSTQTVSLFCSELPKDLSIAVKKLLDLNEITFIISPTEGKRTLMDKHIKELQKSRNDVSYSIVEIPTNDSLNTFIQNHDPLVFNELLTKHKITLEEKLKFDASNINYIQGRFKNIELLAVGAENIVNESILRLTLKVTIGNVDYRDWINLSQTKKIEEFAEQVRVKTQANIKDIETAISKFADAIERLLTSQKATTLTQNIKPQVHPDRKEDAINYLKAKDLLGNTASDLEKAGVIADKQQMLTIFLAFTSRLLPNPISISYLNKGNDNLPSQIAKFFPEDECNDVSQLSENSLFYFESKELNNRILLIDRTKHHTSNLPINDMLSKGKITKITTKKDKQGRITADFKEVETKASFCITYNGSKPEKNLSKLTLVLYNDDSSSELEKKRLLYQKRLFSGKVDASEEAKIKDRFIDIQRILKPIRIINPFADKLKLPVGIANQLENTRLYLRFIESVTFYHQLQREIKTHRLTNEPYIETTKEDILVANDLLKESMLHKAHVLNQPTRLFYDKLKVHLDSEGKKKFHLNEISLAMLIPLTTIKRYIKDLKEHSFIYVIESNRYRKGFSYALTDKDLGIDENSLKLEFEQQE